MSRPYSETDVQTLYNLLGKGVWNLQHLEFTVTAFTALKILQRKREKGTKITKSVSERVLEKQRSLTLGPLIGSAKREATIPRKLLKRFEDFLEERNWLIHKCVINEFLSLCNESKKQALFERISSFVDEAIALKKEVHALMESWYRDAGYNLGYAYQLAEQSIREAEVR